jgi:hypothetical protein
MSPLFACAVNTQLEELHASECTFGEWIDSVFKVWFATSIQDRRSRG